MIHEPRECGARAICTEREVTEVASVIEFVAVPAISRGFSFVEKTAGVGSPPRPRIGDPRRENRHACRE